MQTLPRDTREQIEKIRAALIALVPALRGIYIHGSICLHDFVPGRSDVDILILSDAPMSREERLALADALNALHGRPNFIELSVVRVEDAQTVPVLCQFHFSEMWAPRYAAHDASNPLLDGPFPDDDMPCHIRLTRQSGLTLFGPPPETLLPAIDDQTFWRALTYDLDDNGALCNPVYDALTLARILSFARTRRILAKRQAADWAAREFPAFAPLLREAVEAYRAGRAPEWGDGPFARYVEFMKGAIRRGLEQ
ncbi:MAG: DUF4111 domain-containing protein [Clostridia bacterium]|nr:DUF4111 domain-containing protein [Clostridia bacterium]